MPNPRQIIDENGKYCPVPGTTVVSAIQESDTEFWRTVFNQLKSSTTICRYYTPLPVSSYHMTSIALDTINDVSTDEEWIPFINAKMPFYSKLHEALSIQSIVPDIKFEFVSETNLILLVISLAEEQVSTIKKLAEQYHCENGVPINFHITLAYQHNKNPTKEDYDKIIEELKALRQIFQQKKRIKLDPPKLCYFDDMTRFTPWDGANNPFIEQPSSSIQKENLAQQPELSVLESVCSCIYNSIFGFFLRPTVPIISDPDERQKHTSRPQPLQ